MVLHTSLTAGQFVGRDRELGVVDAALASAARGHGRLLVVSGEAGIGKTRFCDEAARRARDDGFRVVTAACLADIGTPALWPWQSILGDLCGPDAIADLAPTRRSAAGGRDALDAGPALGATDPAGGNDEPIVDVDRFVRLSTIADRVADACAVRPAALVIDDIHGAGAGALLLVRLLAHRLETSALLVLLGRRTGEPAGGAEVRLLDEIERSSTPVPLGRLDDDEAATLLEASGLVGLDRTLQLAVIRATGGSPLHLRQVAALGPPSRDEALPAGVHATIARAVDRLSGSTRRALRPAAILGPVPSVVEAAAVADCDPATVLDAVAEAESVGLAAVAGPGAFAFSHDLVRTAFGTGLSATERLDAHARAAVIVAGAGDTAVGGENRARRARHALAASPRSVADARLAVTACRDAARSMVDGFAFEEADALLDAAVGLHERPGVGPVPTGLLVEWAQAALHCGNMPEARRRFDTAARAARDEDQPELFAEAALGLGGHWVAEHRAPVDRARVLGLQRAALDGLSVEGSVDRSVDRAAGGDRASSDGGSGADRAASLVALRCRLTARLAAEAVFDGGPIGPVLEALDEARACGDRVAVAECLSLAHHALFRPEHVHDRLGLADELVRAASEAGHGVLALMGLCWRCVDLLHLGDAAAPRALEELRERATALGCQNVLYIVAVIDVMLLIRSGHLADAEAGAIHAYELGEACGEVDAFGYLSTHMLGIRWMQGRDAELLDAAEAAAASPTLIPAEFALQAAQALLAARAGDRARARAALDRLAPDGLGSLPRSSTWASGIVAAVEAAALLGDEALAQEAYGLLAPFADLPVIASVGVLCLGSTERALGLAAATCGDLDRAADHLERAVARDQRLGNRPVAAITQAELAEVLARRARPGDTPRARALLDAAIAEGAQMELTGRLDTWRAHAATLHRAPGRAGREGGAGRDGAAGDRPAGEGVRPTAGGGHRAGDGATARRGTIRRRERRWELALDGRRVRVGTLVGVAYLAELLTRPNEPIPALILASTEAGAGNQRAAGRQDVIDDEARAAYAARGQALAAEIVEAEAAGDDARARHLRSELDTLADHVEAVVGLRGRSRAFADDGERARTAVRKAIKRAIDAVDDADPVLAAVLRATVTTGSSCMYAPDLLRPVTWVRDSS